MNATASRGRRILAVLATTSVLLLPAATAQAAPDEHAADRASEAQRAEQAPAERSQRPSDDTGDEAPAETSQRPDRADGAATAERSPRSSDDGVTEDDDTVDNDGGTRPNTPDVKGDGDNQHPSGKDRSEEPGGSGNQGRAQHDPDDDGNGPDRSNGGVDQPGGQGGEDLDDQDGNNGCGNDDDFEDDNEGLCGGNPDRGRPVEEMEEIEETEERQVVSGTVEQPTPPAGESDVAGIMIVERVEREGTVEAPAAVAVTEDVEAAVMGVTFTSQPAEVEAATLGAVAPVDEEQAAVAAQDALPRTGAGLAGLAAMGLTSLAGGAALARRRR